MATLVGNALDNVIVNTSTEDMNDLYGMGGNDKLTGNDNIDYLYGQEGEDELIGGDGNDWLFGGQDGDRLVGGAGIDTVSYFDAGQVDVDLARPSNNTGDAAGDTFVSIENLVGAILGDDDLRGNAEDNRIWGLGGDDAISGRDGDDSLSGEDGQDSLSGGNGNDWLFGGANGDALFGGDGRDGASYRDSDGVVASLDGSRKGTGEAAGDKYSSIENLDGSVTGSDVLIGDEGANSIWGNGGNDSLWGRAGADKLFGGASRDNLNGEEGNDILQGGGGGDKLDGGSGNDTASYRDTSGVTVSLDGSLVATGQAVGDVLESIENLAGSDTSRDRLSGDGDGNALWGYGGNDRLYGRGGDDFLFGGEGSDKITGGAGADQFVFEDPGHGVDNITDFENGDFVSLESGAFGGLAKGFLAASLFQSGSGHDAQNNNKIIYDTDDNSLWYDRDGSGEANAVKLAVLSNGFNLQANDIVIA